jgi:hypothetical protein
MLLLFLPLRRLMLRLTLLELGFPLVLPLRRLHPGLLLLLLELVIPRLSPLRLALFAAVVVVVPPLYAPCFRLSLLEMASNILN